MDTRKGSSECGDVAVGTPADYADTNDCKHIILRTLRIMHGEGFYDLIHRK